MPLQRGARHRIVEIDRCRDRDEVGLDLVEHLLPIVRRVGDRVRVGDCSGVLAVPARDAHEAKCRIGGESGRVDLTSEAGADEEDADRTLFRHSRASYQDWSLRRQTSRKSSMEPGACPA